MDEWLERLRGTIGELVERRVVTGSEGEPILGLVARMRASGETAAVITDVTGRVTGVLTADDLLQRALFALEPDRPVAAAMGHRVPAVSETDRIYKALAAMRRWQIDCLPVVDALGGPIGLIRLESVLTHPVAAFLTLLDSAVPDEGSAFAPNVKAAQVPLAVSLVAKGAAAMETVKLINALNDDIMRAVLRQALATMAVDGWGEPPVDFAALVMGSAGREESLLYPDQDNGFILADYPGSEHDRIDRYFIELAERFTRGLESVGFPSCKGNVMATNPLWRKTLPQWQAQVTGWARLRSNEAIMFTDIFFDFREIFGSSDLARSLRHHVTEAVRDNLPFLAQMSWLQRDQASNLDLFGRLIARDGAEGDAIDLKLRAIKPIVEIVRLLSLKSAVEATGTLLRIDGLAEAGMLIREDAERLGNDFAFLLELLLRHQLDRTGLGSVPDNFLRPEAIERVERDHLVQVFRGIDRLRQRFVANYLTAVA